jgi:hypothetical protein
MLLKVEGTDVTTTTEDDNDKHGECREVSLSSWARSARGSKGITKKYCSLGGSAVEGQADASFFLCFFEDGGASPPHGHSRAAVQQMAT